MLVRTSDLRWGMFTESYFGRIGVIVDDPERMPCNELAPQDTRVLYRFEILWLEDGEVSLVIIDADAKWPVVDITCEQVF